MASARWILSVVIGIGLVGGCTSGTGNGSTSSSTGGASSSGAMGGCTETVPNTGRDPTVEATLQGGGAPDFGCYMTADALGPSRPVRAHGCVAIFGVGNEVKPGLQLSIYGITQNPGVDMPMYGTSDIAVDAASGCESKGTWRAMNLPTNTPLIFKTFDTETGLNKTAVDSYQYNVVLRADRHDRDNDGDFEFEANMVFVGTYTSIPALAGRTIVGGTNITDGIGRAAMAGEFRDCQERSVGGATMFGSCVDQSAKLTYFNGAEDPQPDVTRTTGTQTDGLFAIVNIKASRENPAGGPELKGQRMEMEGKVRIGGQVYSAGKAQVWTFPDSVTIYSPQGLLPTTDPVGSSSSGGVSSSAAGSSSAVGSSSVAGSSSAAGSSSIAGSSSAGGTSAVGSSSAPASSVGASSAVGSSSAPASAAGSSSVESGSSVAGSGGSSVGQSSSL